MALKLWIFPPLFGYSVVVEQGPFISPSFTTFAGLADASTNNKTNFKNTIKNT
ncbi:hypothetical protein HanPSC8_Chr17g0778721 [Helianthus annuus]|nr:hypothetical protein HanPSC8_Chr17g0778721 [Helianthus annuus]